MDDDVRQEFRYLQDANIGIPARRTAMQVLSWGAALSPQWELLGATTSGPDGKITMLYIGPSLPPPN